MTNLPYTKRTAGLHHVAWNLLLAAAMASPMLVARVAVADTQCGDITCGKGFVCKSFATPCTPKSKDGTATSTCEGKMSYSCELAPCSVDADCASDMVCHSEQVPQCTAVAVPACPPDATDCKVSIDLAPPSCTTTTKSTCTPRYALPCNVASDCGEGFTCEPQTRTSCSSSSGGYAEAGGAAGISTGGGTVGTGATTSEIDIAPPGTSTPVITPVTPPGSGGSVGVADSGVSTGGGAVAKRAPTTKPGSGSVGSGGAAGVAVPTQPTTDAPATPAQPPSCTTVYTGENFCKAKTIACSTNADCPTNFTCAAAAVTRDCAVSSDGASTCSSDVAAARTCVPQYYSRQGSDDTLSVGGSDPVLDSGDSAKGESGTATYGSGTNGGTEPATPTPTAPAPAPAASGVTTPGPSETPAADPAAVGNAPVPAASSTTVSGAGNPSEAASGEPSDSSGGCSMSNSTSKGRGLASMLLVALGFAAMRNRRRAQI